MSKSIIQSILIPKKFFTLKEAKKWIKKNKYKLKKIDTTKKYYRFRQINPYNYKKFRTINFSKEIKVIIAFK